MTVLTDSRYAALAAGAASALGASSPEVVRGILAQWECEGQGSWPPARNNPGNIARGLATDLGLAFTVGPGAPQPSNPIVTFASPDIGASAYAAAIVRTARYRTALLAARRGDGIGFVRAIGSSGWGTRASCMLSAYRGTGVVGAGPNLPTAGASSSSAPPATLVGYSPNPNGWSADAIERARAAILSMGIDPTSTTWRLTYDQAVTIARAVLQTNTPQVVNPVALAIQGQTPADLLSNRFDPGKSPVLNGPGLLDFSWVPGFAVNAGVLGIAAYLVISGVRDVLGDAPERAALLAE